MNPERSRTPNFTRFLIVGAILGFIVGAVVGVLGPQAGNYSTNTAVGYLGALGALLGLALAGVTALVVDWLRHRSGPEA